jgi:hypothetical protein
MTGKLMNSDPRMLPEALAARGVKLEQFMLVWICRSLQRGDNEISISLEYA